MLSQEMTKACLNASKRKLKLNWESHKELNNDATSGAHSTMLICGLPHSSTSSSTKVLLQKWILMLPRIQALESFVGCQKIKVIALETSMS